MEEMEEYIVNVVDPMQIIDIIQKDLRVIATRDNNRIRINDLVRIKEIEIELETLKNFLV